MVIIHTRLYQRISRMIVVGAGMAIVAMVGVFYYLNLQSYEGLLASKVQRIARNLADSLALPMWNMDEKQVQQLLHHAVDDEDLLELHLEVDGEHLVVKRQGKGSATGLSILSKDTAPVRAGKSFKMTHQHESDAPHALSFEFPIYYTVNKLTDKREFLGELHVVYTDERIIRMLRRHVVWMVLVGLVFFSGLAWFVASVTRKSLQPIESLAQLLSSQQYGMSQHVALPEATTYEVAHLLVAVSEMHSKQAIHEQQVQQQLEQTERARKDAELALQSKSVFLANMSHELRTPMHAILNFAKLSTKHIPEGDGYQKQRDYLQKIHHAGSRLLGLINNLLDLSKMEAGKMEYHFKTVCFGDVVRQSVDELIELFERKDIRCSIEDAHGADRVEVDADRIVQVLVNLLGNALKFSPEHSEVKVIISMYVDEASDVQMLCCAVEDQGVGIPDGEYESVFQAFTQSTLTDSKSGGTGLGLSICKQIIAAHQGRIWAEPASGSGARFCFVVPFSQAANSSM